MTTSLDPDRRLALAYVPAPRRAALAALWRLDVTLGSVLATGRDPMISRIRLAWWSEALERLDRVEPPAEPVLEAVARHVLPAGVGGAELAAMVEGWEVLVEPGLLGAEALNAYAAGRGERLFRLAARLLAAEGEQAGAAGARWALVDLARRSSRLEEARAVLDAAAAIETNVERWPVALRSLGMLAVLADRDVARGIAEAQGSPGRAWRMIRHRLTGR